MRPYVHCNGATRTCPYCGHRSAFNEKTRVETAPPSYVAGWLCENAKCTRRFEVVEATGRRRPDPGKKAATARGSKPGT